MQGKRNRRRPSTRFIDQIKNLKGIRSVPETLQKLKNKEVWRNIAIIYTYINRNDVRKRTNDEKEEEQCLGNTIFKDCPVISIWYGQCH